MDTSISNQALTLAWKIYELRVQNILAVQLKEMIAGREPAPITLHPPTLLEKNAIIAAITEAQDAGLHRALGPLVRAQDEYDNAGLKEKGALRNAHRKKLDEITEYVRGLKSTNYAVAS